MPKNTDYSPSHPLAATAVEHWNVATDVVAVGFGAAGACAAIEAAEAGAATCIVEASSGNGGASALSGVIYMGGQGGTPIQRAAGFHDDTEDMYNYLLATSGPDADTAKVRHYADHSLQHFEWLVAQGVPYKNSYISEHIIEPDTDDCLIWGGSEEAWPFRDQAKPCPRAHGPKLAGSGAGRLLMDVLAKRVDALGVEVRYDTRAVALIVDDSRRVCGVVLRTAGHDSFLKARHGVVLCAGGFIMNTDMVRQHAPDALRANTPIGTIDDGSGILLGQSAGGHAIHMDEVFATLPWYPPEQLFKGIFINGRGQRFINEDCYHGRVSHYMLRSSGNRFWLLADHDTYAEPKYGEFARITIGATGETWEEVEAELELPEGALTSTVAVYNRFATKAKDPLFHKAAKWLKPLATPPFVALDCRIDHALFSVFTLGGLDTLPTGEVLDASRQPITGLYAAGRTACGIPRWGEGYSSGTSVGDATYFGRLAGQAAATRKRQ